MVQRPSVEKPTSNTRVLRALAASPALALPREELKL
jgi:hypothetical protein